MIASYVKLGFASFLLVLLSMILDLFEHSSVSKRIYRPVRQTIYGILFGALAIIGTEWGIPMNGAQVNCRDAAVLCAGLFFGCPAGIIAGIIGGVERWIAVAWGVGSFTRVACTVSTILAGCYAAFLRKYLFDSRRPVWHLSFAVGVVMEVFHLTMVFITNMNHTSQAITVVRACSVPMILANGLSVMLASLFLSLRKKPQIGINRKSPGISDKIQQGLLITVLIVFILTSFFVVRLQDSMATIQADELLERANREIVNDIQDASDENLLRLAHQVADELSESDLQTLSDKYGIAEISKVNKDGIIYESTMEDFIGFNMASGAQASEFLCLLSEADEYVQDYGPITFNPSMQRKYAGIRLDDGFVQIGYDAEEFQKDMARQVIGITKNRHVGQTGYIIILDSLSRIVSAPSTFSTKNLAEISDMQLPATPNTFQMTVKNEACLCRRKSTEGYTILSILPVAEAMQFRNVAIYVNTFMEILVYALMFGLIYQLIKKLVVSQIKHINTSLGKITNGDLDEVVNVRSSSEFISLSDDINSTVSTLKQYIDEANARIDQELEVARSIQASALPRVNPNFSNRKDLDMHAFMDTAKEVGGDFYDFYTTDGNTLNFIIADVSGKGIPAAMFMMSAKTELKNLTESGIDIHDVFIRGNTDLCRGNDTGMFVTAWQGCLNLNTGDVKFVNAGHNHPLVRHGNGQFEMLKSRANFILGGMEDVRYRQQELHLEKGDILFLYTDGVTEATNAHDELYGDDRLLQVANAREYESMQEMCEAVKKDIDLFVGEAPQFDDITMLAIKYIGRKPDWTLHFDNASLEDIPVLTEQAEAEFERIGCPLKCIMQLSVAIDEIYSNIVKYAYPSNPGSVLVTIHEEEAPRSVSLTFEDEGLPYNPLTNAEPDTTLSAEERKIGGLGIFIVKKTMDEVQYRYENDRNIFTIRKNL